MKCPEYNTLELFAAGLIDDKNLAEQIHNHLWTCPLCAEIFHELSRLNEILDEISTTDENLPQRTGYQKIMYKTVPCVRIFVPLILPGTNHIPSTNLSVIEGEADTASVKTAVRNIATFTPAGGDTDVFIRILSDRDRDQFSLYIIANDPVKYSNVLISVNDDPKQYITDEFGRVIIPASLLTNPAQMKIKVRTPVSFFSLSKHIFADQGRKPHEITISNENLDSIEIEWLADPLERSLVVKIVNLRSCSDTEKCKVLLYHRNRELMLQQAANGRVIFQQVNTDRDIYIKIFE